MCAGNPGKCRNELLKQIETEIDVGECLLQNLHLRKQIEIMIEPEFKVTDPQANPREFMIGLTLTLISSLTDQLLLRRLEQVAAHLKPMENIGVILSTDEFNSIVALRPLDIIVDRRLPLKEFLKALQDYLARDKNAERKPAQSQPARIWGFAPRPHAD